jgi:vesicle transport protein SEC22
LLKCAAKKDTFIQKTKKQYKDTRTQRNLAKLNEDLNDVTRIMTRNIQDVLGRQDALNQMSNLSSQLAADSKKYLKDAKHLNLQALYRKYGPPVIVVFVVLLVIYVRFFW